MEKRRVKGSLQDIDGNACMLMGYFQKLGKQQGDCRRQECRAAQGCAGTTFSKEWIQEVLDEARSSSYDHLVATLLDHTESLSEASGMEE